MKDKKYIVKAVLIALVFLCAFSTPAQAAVKLNKTSMSLNVGTTQTLTVTGTSVKASFKSSKSSVAKVSSAGVVTGVKKGSAVIRVRVGKKTYKCKVTVKQPVKSITLSKKSFYVLAKTTYTLKTTVSPSAASNKKMVFKSSNASVAKVNSAGVVTGVAAGDAVITATAADKSGCTAQCTIHVVKNDFKQTTANVSKNAKRLLSSLDRMSRQIQVDRLNGYKWRYACATSNLFSQAIAANNRKTTCCYYISWGLKEIGVLKPKHLVAGHPNGTIWYRKNGSQKQLKKYTTITKVNAYPIDLYRAGKLKPGDICIWNLGSDCDHTNVFYKYDETTGLMYWYDAGRSVGLNGYFSGNNYYYTTFGPAPAMSPDLSKISYIIRLK